MRMQAILAAAAIGSLGLGGCATWDEHGYSRAYDDYRYEGRQWGGMRERHAGPLQGPGLAVLDPWLRETREGRDIVTLGFSDASEGLVSVEVAHRANIWFRRYADTDRDMCLTDPEIRVALVQAAREHFSARSSLSSY
jgi:hypothetical protein